ncbi:MAG: diguanylate cyclase [Lachnospiraceae bacterium]|nr:diguanylate cyclase [Lachnospiraceae bacterium]
MNSGFIFTNNNCISCNKCVRVCTSPGASFVKANETSSVVHINEERCISCGACFALCEHDAREYIDDTDDFFEDLAAGEPITLLLAPSFLASYPDEYASILGGLKQRGVRRIISVAFGADICTWAYLKYIQENDFYGGISTSCPVAVSYVEHCLPELIPLLIPVQSPLLCAATYCRNVLGITDRLAFIGPCIGKKMETESSRQSPVKYNVTFLKFMEYVRREQIYGPDAADEIEYGLGSFYPAPGGLAENVRWFLGDDTLIRVISGKTYLYRWLNKNASRIKDRELPFFMIDALNCMEGCIEGTAGEAARFEQDESICAIQKIRAGSKSAHPESPWNPALSHKERLDRLNRQFENLQLSDYLCTFTDRSEGGKLLTPSLDEADRIFNEMHKITPESRCINCSTCGYNTCYDLMTAIYNGLNVKESCIHYEMAEAIRLERLSMNDHLTGVMNRSGLQHVLSNQYRDKPLAVIAVDINGLKETNDTYGHEAGDLLIMETANCLSAVFGEKCVFRTGGDEFVIIQQDHTEEECRSAVIRLRNYMKKHNVSAAIGYAYSSCYDTSFSAMQAIADKRMYEDKAQYYRQTGKIRRT